MAAPCTERFIPLSQPELVDALCLDSDVPTGVRDSFRQFCGLVAAILHHDFYSHLRRLKTAYAPFDPDSNTLSLFRVDMAERQRRENVLFQEFNTLMEQAHYRHLNCREIEPFLQGANHLGLRIDVDFSAFERLALFVRGEATERRKGRLFLRPWRLQEYEIPVYRRLVMMLKLRPHPRLGRGVDTAGVFFQLFKNIPKRDITMLLPGARARISRLDRGKISFSLLGGLVVTVWHILQQVSQNIVELLNLGAHPAALWALVTGTVSYGAKTILGYQQTRKHYHLRLTEVLYFQNLDTNTGVLHRVLDEAEEQSWHETVLAYHALWRQAGTTGWTVNELETFVQGELLQRAQRTVGFGTREALATLERLRIAEKIGNRYRARPLDDALDMLEWTWKNCLISQGTVNQKPGTIASVRRT